MTRRERWTLHLLLWIGRRLHVKVPMSIEPINLDDEFPLDRYEAWMNKPEPE